MIVLSTVSRFHQRCHRRRFHPVSAGAAAAKPQSEQDRGRKTARQQNTRTSTISKVLKVLGAPRHGSFTSSSAPTAGLATELRFPLGQRTSTRSTLWLSPNPKWSRGSEDDK